MKLTRNDFATDQHGWTAFLPKRSPAAKFSGTARVRFAVVGAGLTGLACARRLAELHPDEEILLLDARLVGQGASGRNSGYAVATSQFGGEFEASNMPEYQRVNRINQAGLDLLRKQVGEHEIDCQWNDCGFHHTAADKHSLSEHGHFLQYLQAMEIAHTPLEQEELHQRLGTKLYQKAAHVHGGVLLQPAALVRGLADNLPDNVKLYEQSPVLEIKHGAPNVLVMEQGKISADQLFLATNYEAGKIGFLARYLIGSTLSGSFTRILTEAELTKLGNLREWGVLSLHGGGATVRLTADGRICLRNTAEYHGAALLSDQVLAERQVIHRKSFEKRFPQLADVPFEYSWSGVEGISRNGTNFFGQQRENIFLAGGYNGSGVSRGTAFGTTLADYASNAQSELITDCLASPKATWLPPRPFLDIGAAFTVASRFKGVGLDR